MSDAAWGKVLDAVLVVGEVAEVQTDGNLRILFDRSIKRG